MLGLDHTSFLIKPQLISVFAACIPPSSPDGVTQKGDNCIHDADEIDI